MGELFRWLQVDFAEIYAVFSHREMSASAYGEICANYPEAYRGNLEEIYPMLRRGE